MKEKFSYGAELDFDCQKTATEFRARAAAAEVRSCRAWFLTPRETGKALGTLAAYITVTRSVKGRERALQPKQLTLQMVEDQVQGWLTERPPDDYSTGEALRWIRVRLGIAQHALNWANQWRNFTPNPQFPICGECRRIFAADVAEFARRAKEQLQSLREQLAPAKEKEEKGDEPRMVQTLLF